MIKNFFNSISKKRNKMNLYFETSQNIYGSSNLTIDQKIKYEQRRRNQVYQRLDYLLSFLTYFDFFSNDAFKIIKNSKLITSFYNREFVTPEFLFFSFFYSDSKILQLLENYNITKEICVEISNKLTNTSLNQNNSIFNKIKSLVNNINQITREEKFIKNSYEITILYEKASENAMVRFKTPIITSEILFLTLLENNSKIIKLLKKKLNSDLDWYLLKYKLIKRIHLEESKIREEIVKNQHFFGYLLKLQLTNSEFNILLKNNLLQIGVLLFRNTIVSELLQININNILFSDIKKSIKVMNTRKYSI